MFFVFFYENIDWVLGFQHKQGWFCPLWNGNTIKLYCLKWQLHKLVSKEVSKLEFEICKLEVDSDCLNQSKRTVGLNVEMCASSIQHIIDAWIIVAIWVRVKDPRECNLSTQTLSWHLVIMSTSNRFLS